jgi:hypothetical protein
MKTIKISIQIGAAAERVWQTLWADKTYRAWTSVFHPDSYAESDWLEGSEIFFLGENKSGMYGIIETRVENQTMIFKHLGEVKEGIKQEMSVWAGALERYYLSKNENGTLLSVEMDSDEEFEEYFSKTLPKALEIVKQISEQ